MVIIFSMLLIALMIGAIFIYIGTYPQSSQLSIENINEDSYQRYVKFYGEIIPTDEEFITKLKMIYYLIVKKGQTNIREIAQQTNCTYEECVMKIRYLKNKRRIDDIYYIDEVNGIINKCSPEDQELLNKYKLYIYNNHYQIDEIALKLPEATTENLEELEQKVLEDLSYLDDKDLINGIILNKVDGKIIYYTLEKKKEVKDKITKHCQNCGALNELNRGNKIKCEYCGSIVEDRIKEEEVKINEGIV